MDDKPSITLEIPDPEDFSEDSPHVYIPVRDNVVHFGIDLLQCFLIQWKQNEGSAADPDVWDPLAVSAAQMLSGLMGAWAAYYHADDARLLVEQIAWFCRRTRLVGELERELAPLRKAPETGYIADALLALHQETQRRDKERKHPKQQQAAAEQGPTAERDPGWEF